MQLLISLIICMFLLSIIYMDFKENAVQLFLFCGLFLLNIAYATLSRDLSIMMKQVFTNSVIILSIVLLLFVYYSIKEKSFRKFFNQKLGVGDIVFWISIAPLFSTFNYILFFIGSMLMVLLIVLTLRLIKEEVGFIPLAGYQSLFLLVIMLLNIFLINHTLPVDIFHFHPAVAAIESAGLE